MKLFACTLLPPMAVVILHLYSRYLSSTHDPADGPPGGHLADEDAHTQPGTINLVLCI